MNRGAADSFAARLKALRERARYTQEELATIAGLSVHAVSALERGERRRPQLETLRSLCSALDLTGDARDALFASARPSALQDAVGELSRVGLPEPLTPIVGREADLESIRRWLADPAVRLVTLFGPGGVGKTRLALELAHGIEEHDDVRVVFVPLADIQHSSFIASAIGQAFGLADVAGGVLPRRVRAACADRPALLVLDNCEHLDGVTPLVADLLATAGAVRVLATSRAPLHVRGERQHVVLPLALPASDQWNEASQAPAVRLFAERVCEFQPEFRLTSENIATITGICRRLDALPLAIELAAPWIRVLPPRDLLERLESDALVSTFDPGDLPIRQQTIKATVAWSYQLLDADERRWVRLIGALPGPFSIETAAGVLAEQAESVSVDAALLATARLMDRSLLTRTDSERDRPLYRMFETVRAYAALESSPDEHDAVMERLTRHCMHETLLAAEGLAGPAQAEWLQRIRDELHMYRSVLGWLIDRDRYSEAGEIAWGLALFFLIRGFSSEALHWYARISNRLTLPPASEAKARVGAGLMLWAKGEFDVARSELVRALAIAEAANLADMIAHTQSVLGHVESAAGNLDVAREHYTRSAAAYQALAVPWGAGTSLNGLAGIALAAGETDEAERLLDEATRTLQGSGAWFLTPVLYFRAVLAVHRGDADRAIALMLDSLGRIRFLQDKFAFVYALVALAMAATLKGDHAWAAQLLGARDAVAESTGATIVDRAVEGLRQKVEEEARLSLGIDGWARAYSSGRLASIDSLLNHAGLALL